MTCVVEMLTTAGSSFSASGANVSGVRPWARAVTPKLSITTSGRAHSQAQRRPAGALWRAWVGASAGAAPAPR